MNIARSFIVLARHSVYRQTDAPDQTDAAGIAMRTAGGSPTHGVHGARPPRRRSRIPRWKLPITDGPFAESKEL